MKKAVLCDIFYQMKIFASIRTRTAIALSAGMMIFGIVGIVLLSNSGESFLRNATGQGQQRMASLMASSVERSIENEIGALKLRSACGISSSFVSKLTPGTIETMILDATGKVVDSSTKSPFSYTGDQKWLSGLVAGGKDDLFVGEVVLHEPTNTWVMPMAVAVRDNSGALTGIYKAFIDLRSFCKSLEAFKLGSTGDAALVDDQGYLIFQKGSSPYSNKFADYEEIRRVLSSNKRYTVMDGVYRHSGVVVASVAPIDDPALSRSGINWSVFVVRDEKEIYGSLGSAVITMSVIVLLLGLVLIPVGVLLANLLLRPAGKIKEAIEHIGRGDYGYKVDIGTGDEMEDLGKSVNMTAEELKGRVTSIQSLDKERAARASAERKRSQIAYAAQKLRDSLTWVKSALRSAADAAQAKMDQKQKEAIDTASGELERAVAAADATLDVAGLEDGKTALSMEPVDVRDIIRKALLAFEPKVREKGLDIVSDAPKDGLKVKVDPVRFGRAIYALVEDALNSTESGFIRISARDVKNEVEFSVSDSRTGSYPDLSMAHQRVDNDPSLRIFMAKDIVEAHKGRFWAESDEGRGNRYFIRLPR